MHGVHLPCILFGNFLLTLPFSINLVLIISLRLLFRQKAKIGGFWNILVKFRLICWSCQCFVTISFILGSVMGHSKSTFAQDSRVLTPSPPCSPLFIFEHTSLPPPSPKVSSFWLELILPPQFLYLWNLEISSIYLVLVSLVELNVSFKKPQWNLYKVDIIGAWQKCPLYWHVSFLVSPSKNQESSNVNMKSTICHDFPSPGLLEGPNDGKIKDNAKFFSFWSLQTRFTKLVHLTLDHEVHLIHNQWISSHFCWKCAGGCK